MPIRIIIAFYFAFLANAFGKPNVLFILCDDLGYGDLGVFHQNGKPGTKKFSTPRLDSMAAQGVQLRAHYCPAPVCAPSRASLLLGVHQGHAGVRDNQFDKALENNHNLATVLKQAGYATAAIGKWGLQGGGGNPTAWPAYPTKRGFDFFHGYVRHGDGHTQYPFHTTVDPDGSGAVVRPPKEVWEQNVMIRDDLANCYTTDLFTARAKKWIVDHHAASPARPFFMYLAYSTPHAALQVPATAYPAGGGLTGGLQWLGTPGTMINTAQPGIDDYIHPDYSAKSWTTNEKRFATSVRRIDDAVGDLLATLVDLGIAGNTMVVFTSDNGPHHESNFNSGYEANSFQSYGPLDGTKRDCWEGGIREPALAWWPGTIPPGRVSTRPGQFHDWMATFAEAAGVPKPARSDGVSLLPDLTGSGASSEGVVYVEYFNEDATRSYSDFEPFRRGVTRGQMQVVFAGGLKGIRRGITSHADPFEIYDVANDPGETTNLAAGLPDLQAMMKDRVLRLRRPDPSAPRPYDSEFVPPVSPPVSAGVDWAIHDVELPWVADLRPLSPSSSGVAPTLAAITLPSSAHGLHVAGYLLAPADGEYTFYLSSSGGSHLRIHDAAVIDDDFGRGGGEVSGNIRLRAGLHPFRLFHRHVHGTPSLAFEWSGPGFGREVPGGARLRRYDAGASSPPQAMDDSVLTPANTPVVIDVLGNDIDDSVPAPAAILAVSQPRAGGVGLQGGAILYTPGPGFLGRDEFVYEIGDGSGNSTARVRVDVFHTNGDRWYPLDSVDGGSTLEAGGGLPAMLRNFAVPGDPLVPGRFGNALEFDNVDDHLTLDGFPGFQGASSRTCAAWIKTTASGGNKPIIAWGPNTNGAKWTMLMNTTGKLRVEITNGFVVGSRSINDGQWHHVAATFTNDGTPDATDIRLFIDGTPEIIASSASQNLSTGNAGDVRIGADIQNRFWNGLIDEVVLLPRALGSAAIGELANPNPPAPPQATAWWTRYFGTEPVLWSADPDGDGWGNLAEFAFGGQPRIRDPEWSRQTLDHQPGAMVFSYIRRKPGLSPLVYAPQFSNQIGPWEPWIEVPTRVETTEDPAYERVIHELSTEHGDRMFLRIEATLP